MAHELTINENGQADMAYVGAKPWHGLGQQLEQGASIETWQRTAGLDWEIQRAKVHYHDNDLRELASHEVLLRSDNRQPLSVVTNRYKEVQPHAVLEFFRDLIEDDGFTLETAGSLMGGRRIWALAKTGLGGEVSAGDRVNAYVLLATSYDNSFATTAQFTSVRVVCNNTLSLALNRMQGSIVKVRHNTNFDAGHVKGKLGIGARREYDSFMARMQQMSKSKISNSEAEAIIERVMIRNGASMESAQKSAGFKCIMRLFQGDGKGSMLDGAQGTRWGLINAVTEYADFHKRAMSQDKRLNSAWFGAGAKLKESIVELTAID